MLIGFIVIVLSIIFAYIYIKRAQRQKIEEAREYIRKSKLMCLDDDDEEEDQEAEAKEESAKGDGQDDGKKGEG